MTQSYVGQILTTGYLFTMTNYAQCAGQLVGISQYSHLYSLIGNIYGGDGRTTMQLPDLRGRVPISYGNGPGLNPMALGQRTGNESFMMTPDHIPSHTHKVQFSPVQSLITTPVSKQAGNVGTPVDGSSIAPTANDFGGLEGNSFKSGVSPSRTAISGATHSTEELFVAEEGGESQLPMRGPQMAVNFQIALLGVYPNRA